VSANYNRLYINQTNMLDKNASISRGFELIQWAVAAHFDFKMNNKLAGRFQPRIDCVTDAKNTCLQYKKAIEHATSVNYNY
jgi:hypothetical protein